MSLDEGSLSITYDKIEEHGITDYMAVLSITFAVSSNILCPVFETAVHPDTYDNRHRQTARRLCLVSKQVNAWVEPMLYENAILESSKQVVAFLSAFRFKPAKFLARTVKAVWILDHELNFGALYHSFCIFNICHSSERLVCLDSIPCIRILLSFLNPKLDHTTFENLAILQSGSDTAHYISLQSLSLSLKTTVHQQRRPLSRRTLLATKHQQGTVGRATNNLQDLLRLYLY